eukprot:6487087-Amphidinium_carterae.2
MHDLRTAMRQIVLMASKAGGFVVKGDLLDACRCTPAPSLSRTQRNFLVTLRSAAHRADAEQQCPLCGSDVGDAGGLMHALWSCEATSLQLSLHQPVGHLEWPHLFKRFALVTKGMPLTVAEVHQGQEHMTRVLLERRHLQSLVDPPKKRQCMGRPHFNAEEHEEAMLVAEHHPELQPQEAWTPEEPVLIQDTDSEDGRQHQEVAPPRHARQQRRRWKLDELPSHIVQTSTEFVLRYECKRCNCYTAAQAKSAFFAKHWDCSGISETRRPPRHFKRKAMLGANQGLVPNAWQVLDVGWYQDHGILPACVEQLHERALLKCTCCGCHDRPCNRRRFMAKHLSCLGHALRWTGEGSYEIDATALRRGAKRSHVAGPTFENGQRKRLRGQSTSSHP